MRGWVVRFVRFHRGRGPANIPVVLDQAEVVRVLAPLEGVYHLVHKHLARVKALHDTGLLAGTGSVELPGALSRKYPGQSGVGYGSGCSRRSGCTLTA